MIIGVTMGDPTGVGPEIIAGALQQQKIQQACLPIVIGRPEMLRRALKLIGATQVVRVIDSLDRGYLSTLIEENRSETIFCYETGPRDVDSITAGKVHAAGGAAAHDALVVGAKAALRGDFDAIVTAPLHKGALHLAGYKWPGHTELLASLCQVDQFAMMLYLPPQLDESDPSGSTDSLQKSSLSRRGGPAGLGVVHVTLHMALREVFSHLNSDAIFETIELAQTTFAKLRAAMGLRDSPALAVAALNPHCGEGGLFGDEESKFIVPAVERAQALGWNVKGPLSVDTLMPAAVAGNYDAVVAMYHDQGHIALKLLDMFDAVNITLGIPIIRTSVAHGTAHDIAWKGVAKSSGMQQAILTAVRLADKSHVVIKLNKD